MTETRQTRLRQYVSFPKDRVLLEEIAATAKKENRSFSAEVITRLQRYNELSQPVRG